MLTRQIREIVMTVTTVLKPKDYIPMLMGAAYPDRAEMIDIRRRIEEATRCYA